MTLSAQTIPSLTREQKVEKLSLLQEKARRSRQKLIETYYPDTGPLRRSLYKPHMAFFEAGATYAERCVLGSNRSGKTTGIGGYETTLHLTGDYPKWWKGRRFDKPIRAWAAGDTGQTVRDIQQYKLLGPKDDMGTGLIPGWRIVSTRPKPGSVPDAIESVVINHASGGKSHLTFKSFDQKARSFQGTEQDVIWLDEEAPVPIYAECVTRLMTTNGMLLLTFTPLNGVSETVLSFLPEGKFPVGQNYRAEGRKYCINITWDDAPHLSDTQKNEILMSYPPYQREARSRGIPALGSGVIYPLAEEEILEKPFHIPNEWPRAYALDVGWGVTAALFGAYDRQTDTTHFYHEHYRSGAEPPIHAAAIQAQGKWMSGVIDPAARRRNEKDGTRLMTEYINLGLSLYKANNAVEAGIMATWNLMISGRLKVAEHLQHFLREFRLYHRDEDGEIIKENDHLMDCMRYFVLSAKPVLRLPPFDERGMPRFYVSRETRRGRDPVTGY